jgi:hypothetical protein
MRVPTFGDYLEDLDIDGNTYEMDLGKQGVRMGIGFTCLTIGTKCLKLDHDNETSGSSEDGGIIGQLSDY